MARRSFGGKSSRILWVNKLFETKKLIVLTFFWRNRKEYELKKLVELSRSDIDRSSFTPKYSFIYDVQELDELVLEELGGVDPEIEICMTIFVQPKTACGTRD